MVNTMMVRFLSYQSRIAVINANSKYINKDFKISESDLVIDTDAINFNDIVLTAAGHIRPEVLYSLNNLDIRN